MADEDAAGRSNADDSFHGEVREQLIKILASPMFINSARLCRFLRFTVECVLADRHDELKEAIIGREVFDRGKDFDPRIDSIVRVEAQRLRRKLREFYEYQKDANVLIAFRSGSYAPVFRRAEKPAEPQPAAPVVAESDADRLTIAVLPFVNLSPQKDIDYFCDGLTEELITALGSQPELRVIARTTMFTYRNVAFDVRELGTRLGAGSVVEGSARAYDHVIRVSSSLIDSKTGRTVWSARFDHKNGDLLHLQEKISRLIAKALSLRFVGRSQPGLNGYGDAEELYLRARHAWNRGDEPGWREGMQLFRGLIESYPEYVLPYISLSESYIHLATWGRLNPLEAFPQTRKLASEALRLDPDLAPAFYALACVMFFDDRNTTRAIELLDRGLAMQPGSVSALGVLGWCHLSQQRPELGMRNLHRAADIDPLSVYAKRSVGGGYYLLRQYDKAEEWLRSAVKLDATDVDSRFLLAQVLIMQERFEEAFVEAKLGQQPDPHPLSLGVLGQTHALVGQRLEAKLVLEQLRKLSELTYVDPFSTVLVYLGLGDKDGAGYWFNQALERKSPIVTLLRIAPQFDLIRDIANG